MANLATYIRSRRESLRLTQKGLAESAHITQAAISDIERGQTKLPSADIRRRLAKALGVSHIDFLIAAGELSPDEVEVAGVTAVIEREVDDPREQLVTRLRALPRTRGVQEGLEYTIGAMERQYGPKANDPL